MQAQIITTRQFSPGVHVSHPGHIRDTSWTVSHDESDGTGEMDITANIFFENKPVRHAQITQARLLHRLGIPGISSTRNALHKVHRICP